MRKTLLIAGMIVTPISMAVAKTINFDTPVKWNTSVIEQALNKAGFTGDNGANWDVRVTYNRILQDLLNLDVFSINDATNVCMKQCNKSDFLKKGKGASGKKCPELCKGFTNALTSVNNSSASAGKSAVNSVQTQPDGTTKIWSADKKYYVLYDKSSVWETPKSLQKYNNICKWQDTVIAVVFEAQSNQPIALLSQYSFDGHRGYLEKECAIKEYDSFIISFDYLKNKLTLEDNRNNLISEMSNTAREVQQELDSFTRLNIEGLRHYSRWYDIFVKDINMAKNFLAEYKGAGSDYSKLEQLRQKYYMPALSLRSSKESFDRANGCVQKLKNKNNTTINWKNIQTKTPQEAYAKAKADMMDDVCGRDFMDKSKIKCSDKGCGTFPWQNDTVTCIYYDITVHYVFGDICNKEILGF